MLTTRTSSKRPPETVADAELLVGIVLLGVAILLTTLFLPGYL